MICYYNKVNGTYTSENELLLTKILRDEWGYEGFVVSDWGAVNDRVKGVKAGLDLEMPGGNISNDKKIVQDVKDGNLEEKVLDLAVERLLSIIFKVVEKRLLSIIFKVVENKKVDATYDVEKHHKLAREVARECMVLLKNKDNILPLDKEKKIAVIGEFAKNARFQGGGSSHVNATKTDISKVQENIVAVLCNGASIEMV